MQITLGQAFRATKGQTDPEVGPWVLAVLAEAYGHMGQAEERLRILDEALGPAHTHGDRNYEEELYRLIHLPMTKCQSMWVNSIGADHVCAHAS